MKRLRPRNGVGVVRLDDPAVKLERACERERANWVARRVGLPAVGSKLINRNGIEWVVQEHAAVPTYDTLSRWREGEVLPERDLYPVVSPRNFSPKLMEFFHAIDRCTTKTFALLDTMPGRRSDGHVPGGNSIDTVCHPLTNVVFLDAARVHETVIAHEFGHAWVQYVDRCEDFRTMKDAKDPRRMRQVGLVQSFVLDLKVNELLRNKGFDMAPIEQDRAASMANLASLAKNGYRPENGREEVFMALVLADRLLERDLGRGAELERVDGALGTLRTYLSPMIGLAEQLADSVRRHGYGSRDGILQCIDECLLATFRYAGDSIDLDGELIEVNHEEPEVDKFPNWLSFLNPRRKCDVGRFMALNDVASDWFQEVEPSVTGRARVTFRSREMDSSRELLLFETLGPPTRYAALPETVAENLAMMHRNRYGKELRYDGPEFTIQDLYARSALAGDAEMSPRVNHSVPCSRVPANVPPLTPERSVPGFPSPLDQHPCCPSLSVKLPLRNNPPFLPRPYMAGLGRFLTAARLEEQIQGEPPYAYGNCAPTMYIDPGGTRAIVSAGSGGVLPQGSNYGSCGVYSCSEHTLPGHIGTSHRYTCVTGPGGGCSGGLYPASGMWGAGSIGNTTDSCKTRHTPYPVDCRLVTRDCAIAAAICACNKKFIASPPNYIFPIQTCYTYINNLFDCACASLTGSKNRDCLTVATMNL